MTQVTTPTDWWARVRARGPLSLAFWAIGISSWLFLLIITGGQLLSITVWSVPFLLMIAAVSTPWRSVSWVNLVGFFMIGMGPVYLAALLLQFALGISPIEDTTRRLLDGLANSGFDLGFTTLNRDLWAPITEELVKVAPLLFLVFWRSTGFRTHAGPIDYAVVAGATGAGFAFAEDITVFLGNIFAGPPGSSFGLGLGPIYRSLVGSDPARLFGRSDFSDNMSFFYPEMQEIFGVVWSGHGALAFGLGLAIGLAVWLSRHFSNRIFYLIAPAVYLWATWEHMMTNWYGGAGCDRLDLPLCTVADIDLRGRIYPVVVLASLGLAIFLSGSVLRAYRKTDPLLDATGFGQDGYRSMGWRGTVAFVKDGFEFRRWRRKTSYGAFHLEHMRKVRKFDILAVLASRTRALIVGQRLRGEPAEPVPEEAERLMDRVAPLG
jgi:PrsW family intramembrane metalloprotease